MMLKKFQWNRDWKSKEYANKLEIEANKDGAQVQLENKNA